MTRRTEKIARTLQVHLAELVNYHLADPRVRGMVTVRSVVVSADLGYADVYVTVVAAGDAEQRTVVRALQHAGGRLQRLLADRVDLRALPRLRFHLDEKAIRVARTLEAINEAVRRTRPADPAGDALSPAPPDESGSPAADPAPPSETTGT